MHEVDITSVSRFLHLKSSQKISARYTVLTVVLLNIQVGWDVTLILCPLKICISNLTITCL
jgi:hypothetical protein